MIGFWITIAFVVALLALVTNADLNKKDGELDRLAYWDTYWGFYDTHGQPDKALASIRVDLRIAVVEIMQTVGVVNDTWELRAFEGKRSLVRQRRLYYKGTGNRMPVKHVFGFALDVVPWNIKKKVWDFAAMVYFEHKLRQAVKQYLNVKWGGNWSSRRDLYHLELTAMSALYITVKNTLKKEGLA